MCTGHEKVKVRFAPFVYLAYALSGRIQFRYYYSVDIGQDALGELFCTSHRKDGLDLQMGQFMRGGEQDRYSLTCISEACINEEKGLLYSIIHYIHNHLCITDIGPT